LALLTDLGVGSDLVGVLHAVARDVAPHAHLLDITHDIAVDDARAAAMALARVTAYLPTPVVTVVAVDSDAGRPVAVEVAGGQGLFIGPDSGVLASAVAIAGGAERAVILDETTLHGVSPGSLWMARDVFVPCAARWCAGVDVADLGSAIDPHLLLPGTVAVPRLEDDEMVADVTWVDRAGNCQLNVGADDLPDWGTHVAVTVGLHPGEQRVARLVANRQQLATGAVGLMVDPFGMWSLVMNRRSASHELSIAAGDQVRLAPGSAPSTSTPVQLRNRE
jgi:hypothetical protein